MQYDYEHHLSFIKFIVYMIMDYAMDYYGLCQPNSKDFSIQKNF